MTAKSAGWRATCATEQKEVQGKTARLPAMGRALGRLSCTPLVLKTKSCGFEGNPADRNKVQGSGFASETAFSISRFIDGVLIISSAYNDNHSNKVAACFYPPTGGGGGQMAKCKPHDSRQAGGRFASL